MSELEVQDRVAPLYEQRRYAHPAAMVYHRWWMDKMLSLAPIKGRILDNGCGTGLLLDLGRRPKATWVGLDLSAGMLAFARKRCASLVRGDAQRLPFADGSFDVVMGRGLLHHLPKPQDGVAEMARVLKPNGTMVVCDTNASLLSALPRHLAQRGEHFSEDHQNMSSTQLQAMISVHFKLEVVYFFGYLAYPFGFPDILDLGRLPGGGAGLVRALIKLDEIIARLPGLRRQSWGIIIKGTKRGN